MRNRAKALVVSPSWTTRLAWAVVFAIVALACATMISSGVAYAAGYTTLGGGSLSTMADDQSGNTEGGQQDNGGQEGDADEQKGDISSAVVTLEKKSFAYTGSPIQPTVTVALNGANLVSGTDFDVTFQNNTAVGTANVVIVGKGAYTGSCEKTFAITRASLASAKVAKVASRTYSGKLIKPKPAVQLGTLKLKLNRDYTLSYKANRKAGKASIVIKGKGNYSGKKTVGFTIKRASVSKAKVAKIADRTYSGKLIKPKPTVKVGGKKLKLNRDYTLRYKANRAIGKATVVIKGKGNYSGKRTVTFKIVDWVQKLNIAKTTKQLIIVKVRGVRAEVTMHVKSKGFWRPVISTSDGWIGSAGLGEVSEGSRHTPAGVLYPDMAFGINGDPGCKMGYTQADWSNYWCSDPGSPHYNTWLSTYDTTNFDPSWGEHIISCGYAYNYCLNMGWNKECVPYGGSAFFMHCTINGPTAGCIGIPEGTMISILQTVKPGVAMVIDTPKNLKQY